MKLLLLTLLVAGAFSMRLEGMAKATQKHVEELNKSQWGRTILELVDLHSMVGGPVQELITGIEELIADLNDSLQELDFNFNVRTNEHNGLVLTLEQNIQDATIDIQRADDTLENLLKPRRSQLRDKIKKLQGFQQANRQKLNEITLVRQQQHEAFEAQQEEYAGATQAVDDALALLNGLTNPSLAQIQRFHHSLRKIEARIQPHTEHATLIKALIMLASEQNFSDQNMLREIVTKLNEFRVAIVDAINDSTALEAQNVTEFEERVAQLNKEFAEFQRGIASATIDLNATQDKINQYTEFISQREADRKAFTAQLDLENQQYAQETDIYTNLKNEYLRELAVAEQALNLVTSVDFSNIKL